MYLRSRWLLMLMFLCAVPCARSESLPESVRACARESDAGRRLACYDEEIARVNQPAGQEKDSQTEDRFGAEGKQLPANGSVTKLDKLQAQIGAISHRPDGKLVLHLVNDQIWEQTEDGPDLRLQEGDIVQIKRGVLGAYWLSAHSRGTIKVQRTH
jgi:hypothetical protein